MIKKSLFVVLVLALMALSVVGVSANDVEGTEAPLNTNQEDGREVRAPRFESFDDFYAELLTRANEKYATQVADGEAKLSELVNRISERSAHFTDVLSEVAPALIPDFEANANGHITVHTLLSQEGMSIRDSYHSSYLAEMEMLYNTLAPQVDAGELDMVDAIRQMMDQSKALIGTYRAAREAYFAEIEPLNAANAASVAEMKAVMEQVKVAIEAEDFPEAESLLVEVLAYRQAHIEFDYAKLAILSNY